MNVLIWFKRDLRLADHPALHAAAAMGRVLPLYIVEPDQWHQADASARQWAFIAESLLALREDLAAIGAPLILRMGDAREVLDRLCRQHDIARLISHEEAGSLWVQARNRRVADWAQTAGVEWVQVPQRRDAASEPLPAPIGLSPVPGLEPGPIPSAKALRLTEDRCPHRQPGGRPQALSLLESFLTQRGAGYGNTLATSERASSRLSPHLALGTLSLAEVQQATRARQAERPGPPWSRALSGFQGRLSERATALAPGAYAMEWEFRSQNRAAQALRHGTDASRLHAWERGETGLPFLDAAMRYLAATGWLHHKLRQMVLAVASHQLWLDWRLSGAVLARFSTDYDAALHWPQVQQAAGVFSAARPRIVNPVSLARQMDPAGRFTRAWLPELAAVPDAFLQQPWIWPGFRSLAGRRYPEPIVDLKSAERAARAEFAALPRPAPSLRRPEARAVSQRSAQGQLRLEL